MYKKFLLSLILGITLINQAYSAVYLTSQGGTATNTAQPGFVLMGKLDGSGVWTQVATSALGISGGGGSVTGTYPIVVSGSAISIPTFNASTSNIFNLKQTFANASATSLTADTLYSTLAAIATLNSATAINASGTLGVTGRTDLYGLLNVIGKTTFANASGTALSLSGYFYDVLGLPGTSGQVLSSTGTSTKWITPNAGTVTAVSVASANGFAGSSSGGATPQLTLSTTVTGILVGNGTAIAATTTTGDGNVVLSNAPTFTGKITFANASGTGITATDFYGGNFRGAIIGTTGTFSSTLDITGKTTFTTASGTGITATDFYGGTYTGAVKGTTGSFSGALNASSTLGVTGQTDLYGKLNFVNASGTGITVTDVYTTTFSGTKATSTNINSTNSNSTNSTSTNFGGTNATFTNATTTSLNTTNFNATAATSTNYGGTNATFTNATTTSINTTNLSLVGNTNSCVATNAAGQLVASSTACGGGGASLSGGANGYVTRWTGASTVSTGIILDNATVAGVNATSSTVTFNVKGNAGTSKAVDVASSSATSMFTVDNTGKIGIASSTPAYHLTVATGSAFIPEVTVATSTALTLNLVDANQFLVRYGVANIVITFSNVEAGKNWKVITCAPPSGTPGTIYFSTSTYPVRWNGGTLASSTNTVNKCDTWSFIATNATSSLVIFGGLTPNF